MTEQNLLYTFEGHRYLQTLVVLVAVTSVALADVLLKKAALAGNLTGVLRSPWLWGAIVLYLVQICIFTFAFISGWKLGVIGALQTALYALIVLTASVLFFREHLTSAQIVGVLMALGGVLLIHWP